MLKTVRTATGICQTLLASGNFRASKQQAVSVWHVPVAVCTVFSSWWWM